VLCQLPKYQLYGRRKQECEESFQSRTERNNATLHFLLADRLSAAQKEKLALRLKNSNAAAKTVRMLLEHQDSRDKQYQWAVADFIASQYVLPDVFRGTAACQELRELENILQVTSRSFFSGRRRTLRGRWSTEGKRREGTTAGTIVLDRYARFAH